MSFDGDRRVGDAALHRHFALAVDMNYVADLNLGRVLAALHAPVRARRVVDEEERQVAALESDDASKVGRRGLRSNRGKHKN